MTTKQDRANKRFNIFLLVFAFAIAIVIFVLATKAYGQNPNVYGIADFASRNNYTTNGLVFDMNFLTSYPMGDITQGQGDFETGSTSGGCTYCPTGFTCYCDATSNITDETSKLYKNNHSIKFVTDASNHYVAFWYVMTFVANSSYQISFRYKGESGGENFYTEIRNGGGTDYYNRTTDQWQVGASGVSYSPTTAWQTANVYINNGAIQKGPAGSYGFYVTRLVANQTIYFDDFQIRELRSTGPHSDVSNITMTVNGDPSFDSQNAKNSFKGQPGNWGTTFNGTTDYLSYPDTGDTFDPCSTGKECQMTIACRFVPTAAGLNMLMTKYVWVPAELGWDFYYTTGVYILLYVRTVAGNSSVSAGAPILNTLNSTVATYFGVADSTSLMDIYLNNNSVVSISNAHYPIGNNTTPMEIARRSDGTSMAGAVYQCSFYNKRFNAVDASKWNDPYFPGNNFNRGFYVTTCTQAASHATCSWDTCRDGTPNACQAEETGSMAIFDTKTELVPYNSFETVVGDDSNPTFTGWTITETAGDGTAKVTAYRDSTQHGNISARMKITGTTSLAQISTSCISVSPTTSYYFETMVKTLGSRVSFGKYRIGGFKYTDGACSAGISSLVDVAGQVSSSNFSPSSTTFTTAGDTNSIKLNFYLQQTNADILVDSISLKAGTYRTPWVHNSGAGSTSYNARVYQLHNTLVDAKPDGGYPWSGGWCMGAWVYNDWNWDSESGTNHDLISIPGTAGNNNFVMISLRPSVDELDFIVYDSAGNYYFKFKTSVTDTIWTANSWKYVEACTSNTGTVNAHHYNSYNSTWYDWPSIDTGGVGTGIVNNLNSYVEVGNHNYYLNGYIPDICFAPYNAAFSYCGWNNGIAPKAPY